MKKSCPCGNTWEGEGACERCALLAGVRIRTLEEKLAALRQGFSGMLKITADIETARPEPGDLGPLMRAAWKIRQLAKERDAAIKRAKDGAPAPGSWAWAVEQMERGLMVRRESTTGAHKLRLDREDQGRITASFKRVPGPKDWDSANVFVSHFEATDWVVWP